MQMQRPSFYTRVDPSDTLIDLVIQGGGKCATCATADNEEENRIILKASDN
jgi:uncharacterized protein YhfF